MPSEEEDIDRRIATLKNIDDAKFGWHHVRACLVSGTGFLMDAYDLFAINLASTMIGYVYFDGKVPPNVDLGLKVSASVGTFIGQLGFGYLADRLGRKKMYGVELMIIIVATVASALCGNGAASLSGSQAVTVAGSIMFWRVIMGVGIGGDYPLSAIITSEFATKNKRGAMMGAVFAMQGFGILVASIIALIVITAYKSAIIDIGNSTNYSAIDYCWRLVLGFGAVPGVAALYFRITIPESPRYTMDVENNINKATSDATSYLQKPDSKEIDGQETHQAEVTKASWSDFNRYFGIWKNKKILIGTAVSWFCLDVAFYGIGLNNNIILNAIGYARDTKSPTNGLKAFNTLNNAVIGNVIIALLGTVPGYWVTVAFVDRWGRKPIQIMGFAILTALFIIMGAAFDKLKENHAVFIFLFTLAQFFQNFGPNTTTFIVPGEVFPTRYRSTGHGISAASGKLGAIVAQVGFSNLKDHGGSANSNNFVGALLLIFAVFMFLGLLASFLIPETKGLSLEELSNEEIFIKGKLESDVAEIKERLEKLESDVAKKEKKKEPEV